MESDLNKQSHFPPTRWSLVARAGSDKCTMRLSALNELLAICYPALLKYLILNMQLSNELAKDLLQSFVHEKIIEKQLLKHPSKERGKFRSFMLKSLTNYVRDYFRKQQTIRNKHIDIELNDYLECIDSRQADWGASFDLLWAQQIIAEIIKRMQLECESKQRDDLWLIFKSRLLDPILHHTAPLSYDELIKQFDLKTPSQATNLLITSKRMFKRIFDDVVRDTVTEYSDFGEEIKNLKKILATGAGLHSI